MLTHNYSWLLGVRSTFSKCQVSPPSPAFLLAGSWGGGGALPILQDIYNEFSWPLSRRSASPDGKKISLPRSLTLDLLFDSEKHSDVICSLSSKLQVPALCPSRHPQVFTSTFLPARNLLKYKQAQNMFNLKCGGDELNSLLLDL